MDAKREQALVGLFVLIASGLLLVTIFALSGAFGRAGVTYRTYFKFAGGLEPGSAVRYGGVKVGRVDQVRVNPQDSTRIEVTFSVRPDTPIKRDSSVKIWSLSPLGDNYLEVGTGTSQAQRAPSGTLLPSSEYIGFADLTGKLDAIAPQAKQLLESLNQRAAELQVTIARVNDLLNEQNRANLSASLGDVRGMLEENRPKIRSTMSHLDTASTKLAPLIDDFKKTVERADKTLAHLDSVVVDNREDLHEAIVELRKTLTTASSLVGQLDRTMSVNAENIDEMLENMRHTTENLKEFTDTIKARPYTLIRAASPPEHKPGGRSNR